MDRDACPEILVKVTRGSKTESIHRGHIAAVNIAQKLIAGIGSSNVNIFARSAAKPLQAIPVIAAGAADRFGWSDAQIALLCASHNGEPIHARAAESILESIGLDASALECGIHDPYLPEAARQLWQSGQRPSPLHNNCSGKHAGMLALSIIQNVPFHQYILPEHPVQQKMLHTISELSNTPANSIDLGTDGCGVPVFRLPLSGLALAYARFGTPDELSEPVRSACERLISALRSSPQYIAGRDRFDTALIQVTKGRIIGKMGAEGIFAATVAGQGLGIAVKIEDGNLRAAYPAVIEALKQLDLLSPEELDALAPYSHPAVLNRHGISAGAVLPEFKLERFQ